jgi:MoxR-like ATPase
MEWRDFASPDDVKKVAKRILRHRIWLSYRAEADNISADDIIQGILDSTKLV